MSVTLSRSIQATDTLLAVANAGQAALDDVFLVDDELVVVRGTPRAGSKLFVGRGYLGTTRAAHAGGATLEAYDATTGGSSGVTVDNTVDPPFAASTIIAAGATESAPDEATLAGAVFAHTVTLTNAQVLALTATPVNIIPAQGSGYGIDVLRVELVARIIVNGREYTNVDAAAYFGIGPADPGPAPIEEMYVTNNTGFGNDLVTQLIGTFSNTGIGGNTVFAGPALDASSDFGPQATNELRGDSRDNKPIALTLNNGGSGALGGGNAANTLIVRCLYSVVPLS